MKRMKELLTKKMEKTDSTIFKYVKDDPDAAKGVIQLIKIVKKYDDVLADPKLAERLALVIRRMETICGSAEDTKKVLRAFKDLDKLEEFSEFRTLVRGLANPQYITGFQRGYVLQAYRSILYKNNNKLLDLEPRLGNGVQFRDGLIELNGKEAWLEIKAWVSASQDAVNRLGKQFNSHFRKVFAQSDWIEHFDKPIVLEFVNIAGRLTTKDRNKFKAAVLKKAEAAYDLANKRDATKFPINNKKKWLDDNIIVELVSI